MDLDLDLSALGLPNRRDNTLSALKKKAESAQERAPPPPSRSPAPPPRPQKPVPLAGLDELANIGRPAPKPAPPPADDFLGAFASLSASARPDAPRPPPRPPSVLDEPLQSAGGAAALGDDFFGAPPANQSAHAHPAEPDLLDDFFSGAKPCPPPSAPAPAAAPAAAAQAAHEPVSEPAAHQPTPADDFFGGVAPAPPAAAQLVRPSPLEDDDFFGGGRTEREAERAPADSASVHDLLSSERTGESSKSDGLDDFDFFAGGGAAASAPPSVRSFGRLDDLASVGGSTSKPASSDPLADALFSPSASAASPSPSARPAAARAHVAVSQAEVAAAAASGLWAQQEAEETADPNEPPERTAARRRRHEATRNRVEAALREQLERDALAKSDQAERHEASDAAGPRIAEWKNRGKGNVRMYLSTLQDVLWEGHSWKAVGLTELVAPLQVKKAYMKVLVQLHPDKVQQRGGSVAQRFVADAVFHVVQDAYAVFAGREL